MGVTGWTADPAARRTLPGSALTRPLRPDRPHKTASADVGDFVFGQEPEGKGTKYDCIYYSETTAPSTISGDAFYLFVKNADGTQPVGTSRREALENQWSITVTRHYRAAEPRRQVKDTPLYTL
ncbi:hypothetical protein ACF1G0_30375 [Streptomyces sp. NPDC013953]|uniref:hypothetical protein n=1 Tax=Streptomyces sp. NPDC013953 TaxID=3364868 RepID=UPI00370317A4